MKLTQLMADDSETLPLHQDRGKRTITAGKVTEASSPINTAPVHSTLRQPDEATSGFGPCGSCHRAAVGKRKRKRDAFREYQHMLVKSRDEERLRLARELHDGPIQELYAVQLALHAQGKHASRGASVESIAVVQSRLQHVVDMLRDVCWELRPPALVPFGLAAAIRSHADRFETNYPNIAVQRRLAGDVRILAPDLQCALYYVYQEAMANAAKHSTTSWIIVRLNLDAKRVLLEVRDGGCGFTVPDNWLSFTQQGHFGLVGIAERAEAIDSQLVIESAPHRGRLVRITAPTQFTPAKISTR